MATNAGKMSDAELVALAQADRGAGIPYQQTAVAAAEAAKTLTDRDRDGEVEAHPN